MSIYEHLISTVVNGSFGGAVSIAREALCVEVIPHQHALNQASPFK
jgi:hypothetical protein